MNSSLSIPDGELELSTENELSYGTAMRGEGLLVPLHRLLPGRQEMTMNIRPNDGIGISMATPDVSVSDDDASRFGNSVAGVRRLPRKWCVQV